jgi:hypothetical protein
MTNFHLPHSTKHDAWAENGTVMLANEEDGYYGQIFRSRDELNTFIGELHGAADEAWGRGHVALTDGSEEVIRVDNEGFHYRGQFIADAGEAHHLLVQFLKKHAQ